MQPLEYGLVLAMILPIALSFAFYDVGRSWLAKWWPVFALGLAAALSVSRSALVGVAVGLIVLAPTWPPRIRRAALAGIAVMSVGVYVAVPGLAGTLRGLFTGISEDSSTVSRSGSYDIAGVFISRDPLVGRGFGTFLPEYRIFDNQYLLLVVEVGLIGLAAFLGLSVTGMWAGRYLRRHADDEIVRALGQGLVASVAAGAVLMAFFDGFSFPKAIGSQMLIIGLAGAGFEVARRSRLARTAVPATMPVTGPATGLMDADPTAQGADPVSDRGRAGPAASV